MSGIGPLFSFFSVLPSTEKEGEDRLNRVARVYWWFAPLFEFVLVSGSAVACLWINSLLQAPMLTAALFLVMDHGFHGLRRLDGFADLWEGIFYRSADAGGDAEAAWEVVRSPQIGAFGAGVVSFYILLYWNILAEIMRMGDGVFLLTAVATAVMSRVSVAVAMRSPEKFRFRSRFGSMAAILSRPSRILLLITVCLVITGGLAWIVNSDLMFTALPLFLLPPAVFAGWGSKKIVLASLKKLNGDIIGFSWCLSELFLALILFGIWRWLL